jgi:amino acid transporter
MDITEAAEPSSAGEAGKKYLSVQQAAFIGVGAMVGAGIFALLGAAGEVAGAAVWLSFLIAGFVAVLQGYSFAKLGARYPSAGGLLEYVAKATGNGHFTGITSWLTYLANAIVTAMVAVSFGSYAASTFAGENQAWTKVFSASSRSPPRTWPGRPASCPKRCSWRWASRPSSTWPSHSACSARSRWTR